MKDIHGWPCRMAAALAGTAIIAAGIVLPSTAYADGLSVSDSGLAAVAADSNKVLDLNFNQSDLDDSSNVKNTIQKTKGTITYEDGVGGTKGANFTNAAASLGVSQELQSKDLTLSFWYNPNAKISSEQILMWAKGQYNQDGWYLSANAEDKPLVLSVGARGSGSQPAEFVMDGKRSEIFKPNQWTHVMVSWNDSSKTAVFYINGIRQSAHTSGDQNAGKTIKPTTDTKYIGWNGAHNSGGTLNGILDEVRVWNVTANTADVEREVMVGLPKFDAASVAEDALDKVDVPQTATSNITLPTESDNGTSIQWESDQSAVISDTGTVIRPAKGEKDAKVTLRASATYGSKTVAKQYTVTVPAQTSGEPQEYSGKYLSESDMSNVSVADEYLTNAGQKEIEYLLSFDTDRLLVEFRTQAGLDTKGVQNYGGWERGYSAANNPDGKTNPSRFTGHFVGHYISAISEAQRSTFATDEQKEQLAAKLKAMVLGIRESQEAYAKKDSANAGFFPAFKVDAVPNGKDGLIVPFYNLHKVEQGMVHAYMYATDDETREAAQAASVDFAKWIVNWKAAHSSVNMLSTEYGGMNDALYQVAEIAGTTSDKKKALEAAHLFDETSLFQSLADGKDVLNGKHANTTIPKLTGAMQRYVAYTSDQELYDSLSSDEQGKLTSLYLKAARNFWDIVVNHHTYVNGGNSQSEHFHVSDQTWKDATANGDPANGGGYQNNSTVETCNEHNMLRLTRLLFQVTKQAKYSEYYEHTFINSIVASQNPETGMTEYFQPMKAGYPKVFGTEYGEFWCCQGTGIENFAKLNDSMWFTDKNDVYVNMFISSTFADKRHGLRITQTANVPKRTTVTFTVEALGEGSDSGASGNANLKLRLPEWTTADATLNGRKASGLAKDDNGWLTVAVKAGDTVTYELPAKLQAHTSQDNKNWVAFTYGPLVLAGSLKDTDATSNYGYGGILVRTAAYDASSNAMAQIFPAKVDGKGVSTSQWLKNFEQNLVRTDDPADGKDLSFEFRNVEGDAANVKLQPYYSLYKTTYAVYWDLAEVDSEAYQNQIIASKEEERDGTFNTDLLNAFDNQEQNEKGSHNLNKVNSTAGSYKDQPYREAKLDGWISYDLKVNQQSEKNYLGVRLYSGDSGRNGFDVWIDPTPLASEEDQAAGELSGNAQKFTISYDDKANGFYWNNTEIPAELIAKVQDGKVRVKFAANDSTKTVIGGIYGVRTTTAAEYSKDASLKSLAFDKGDLSPKFNAAKTSYTLTVPKDTASVNATIVTQGHGEYVMVDDVVVKDGADNPREIAVDGEATTVTFASYAQDHATVKYYTVNIVKEGSSVPEATKPVVEYRFDNDSDVADGKIVTNSGTLGDKANGTVVNEGASLAGENDGKALVLTGGKAGSSSPYVKIPAGAISDDQQDLTISAKVKWDGSNSCVYPFNLGQDSKNYLSYIVNCGSETRVEAKVNNSLSAKANGGTPAKNTWVDVAVVLRGGKSLSYYLDGKLVKRTDTTLVASQVKGTDDFTGYLGKSFYNDPYFGGAIDDFRMWNRAVATGELFGGGSVEPDPEPEVDKTELRKAYDAAKDLTNDDGAYTADSWTLFVNQRDTAKARLDGDEYTQEQVDNAVKALANAQKRLKKAVKSVIIAGAAEITLTEGTNTVLVATVNPSDAADKAVTWTSSDEKVVTISADGKVTAIAIGTAQVTATAGGVTSAPVTVTVRSKEIPASPASDEEFNKLEEAIKSEDDAKLDEKDYTADSWGPYQTALDNAKDVLGNRQSASEQVQAALAALSAAKQGLTKASSGQKPNGGQGSGGSAKPNGDADSSDAGKTGASGTAVGTRLSATGATVVGVSFAAAALLGTGLALISYRRRRF